MCFQSSPVPGAVDPLSELPWFSRIVGQLKASASTQETENREGYEGFDGGTKLVSWAQCGDSSLSLVPAALWALGAAALTHRLLSALFRRFIFRRVPLWELILQRLLFLWMVIYSIHFWVVLVGIVKVFVEYCYDVEEGMILTSEDIQSQKIMQQWIIWMFGAIPLCVFVQTRPRPVTPPLMIWITTSPWLRREMGPYGYYLNRPFPDYDTPTETVPHALTLRRAFSDSKTLIKEPRKKRRNSKSV